MHYEACERLQLSDAQIQKMGVRAGDKMSSSLLVTGAQGTRTAAERSAWDLVGAYSRMGRRIYEGSSSQYVKLGPSKLLIEHVGNPLFSIRYFRTAHASFMRGTFRSLGVDIITSPTHRIVLRRYRSRRALRGNDLGGWFAFAQLTAAAAASIRDRSSPAHVVVDRLAANASDRPAKALTMLGRVVRTTFIMRYLHDAKMRDRVQLQLNRGEGRHALSKRIFFGNQAVFRTGEVEELMNKVSALSVLSNAVLVWNTIRIAEIIASLDAASDQPVRVEELARVSPLLSARLLVSGRYNFDRAIAPDPA
jgi:hypothetical protein